MNKFVSHTGKSVALYRQNIDTDQIMPKQFLTRIERSGFGEFVFYDWRFESDGTPKNDFVLNDPKFNGASILIAGANFGCGSSREHAPWGLLDYGFRVVISPGFADIFYNNSLKNGLLPVVLAEADIVTLTKRSATENSDELTVDLQAQTVSDNQGFLSQFEIDQFQRRCLLNGLDGIALTLQHEEKIHDYETQFRRWK